MSKTSVTAASTAFEATRHAGAVAITLMCLLPAAGFAQARQPSSAAAQTELMGCVIGGNLQPVEQPFVLEPAEPFQLDDVVRRDELERLVADSARYEITGIDMTPWLGLRVKVEGVLVDPGKTSAQAVRTTKTPQIRANRVTSIWGTCASKPSWTPVPQK